MRILYLGLPLGALILKAHGFDVVAAGISYRGAPGTRRLRRQTAKPAPLILGQPDLNDNAVFEMLLSAQPDVLLSWFWPKQIPSAIIATIKKGAYGVHPSLLPRWRGPDPYFWSIYAGDTETGVTLHRVETHYDVGEILHQKRIKIACNDSAWSLAKRLDRPSLELLIQCAQNLAGGKTLKGTAQIETQATYAPQPSEDILRIDWSQTTQKILRLIRAAAPYPGATALLNDTYVEVISANTYTHKLPSYLRPADAFLTDDVVIKTADGALILDQIRLEDGSTLKGIDIAVLLE